MAGMDIHGDPWKAELDALADQLADAVYGKGANVRAEAMEPGLAWLLRGESPSFL
jgi:hypothetical protein